jgi:hypothetical protein
MAKIFHFTPNQVDDMDGDKVKYFLHLESEWRKRENETNKK